MKPFSLITISSITASTIFGLPTIGSVFLINQMVDFYCNVMEGENTSTMNSYDRGLNEGMAIGWALGQYPEKVEQFSSISEQEINNQFYSGVDKKCPQYSFGVE